MTAAVPEHLNEGSAAAPRLPVVVAIGNPNTGKSTLFNALTGLRQKVGNYPGVTVERHVGIARLGAGEVQIVDLPGTYSLAAHSPDEMVAIDVLSGAMPEIGKPDAALVVADASNLRRNLYLASQILELDLPVVIALNMVDLAASKGMEIDAGTLESRLGARVVPIVAAEGRGIDALREALGEALAHGQAPGVQVLPKVREAAAELALELGATGAPLRTYDVERALIDDGGYAEQRLVQRCGPAAAARLEAVRAGLQHGPSLATEEARERYAWINAALDGAERRTAARVSWSDRIDRYASHPVLGSILFVVLMGAVFQAVFSWAVPLMDLIDRGATALEAVLTAALPAGALTSLLTDGVIAGVGSVIVFLPQIIILFAFIIFLEDTGYMARAAFLMDRLMRWCGLSGQSFIPMLSSFACAVPGIMGTRIIPNERDRIATILAAPFMTCSARLPVYALLIAAFVPRQYYLHGLLNLQGLVLLGLYLLGILGGVLTALLLKRTILRGPTPSFLLELPPYRWPNLRSVGYRLWERGRIFLRRAGTVIFTVALVVWALAYFPHPQSIHQRYDAQREQAQSALTGDALKARVAQLDHEEGAAYLEQSLLGRIGKGIEPIFRPLGWDWKISAGVVASFPAREVVIAVLGTIYAVGSDVDPGDRGLIARLKSAAWPDGRPVFSTAMAIGLMIFYAFCLQCVATIATIRRETNTWRWPAFAWGYMTAVGYLGALLVFQLGGR